MIFKYIARLGRMKLKLKYKIHLIQSLRKINQIKNTIVEILNSKLCPIREQLKSRLLKKIPNKRDCKQEYASEKNIPIRNWAMKNLGAVQISLKHFTLRHFKPHVSTNIFKGRKHHNLIWLKVKWVNTSLPLHLHCNCRRVEAVNSSSKWVKRGNHLMIRYSWSGLKDCREIQIRINRTRIGINRNLEEVTLSQDPGRQMKESNRLKTKLLNENRLSQHFKDHFTTKLLWASTTKRNLNSQQTKRRPTVIQSNLQRINSAEKIHLQSIQIKNKYYIHKKICSILWSRKIKSSKKRLKIVEINFRLLMK